MIQKQQGFFPKKHRGLETTQILKRGVHKKNECLGDLKSSYHRYLPVGLTMFLLKKKTFQNKI